MHENDGMNCGGFFNAMKQINEIIQTLNFKGILSTQTK